MCIYLWAKKCLHFCLSEIVFIFLLCVAAQLNWIKILGQLDVFHLFICFFQCLCPGFLWECCHHHFTLCNVSNIFCCFHVFSLPLVISNLITMCLCVPLYFSCSLLNILSCRLLCYTKLGSFQLLFFKYFLPLSFCFLLIF